MKTMFRAIGAAVLTATAIFSQAAEPPLRVFLRTGAKTHGPGQHDHPRFLAEWAKLLNQRGARCDGAMDFPTVAQIQNTDVLVMYAADAGSIAPDQRAALERFLQRGGGLVVIHDAVVGNDPHWWKTIIGGAWEHGVTRWLEGPMDLYYVDRTHPITRDVANFHLDDEIYYDLPMMPEARVLAAAFTPKTMGNDPRGRPAAGKVSVYDIQPQMWVYEKGNYRAFVSIPGHNHTTFSLPHYRAVLLRGIAWAGKRANLDEFCSKDELASLRYPAGGPIAPENAAVTFELHPDFQLSLVAAEPLINKPIAMDWDPQGRLWVAETPEYPDGRWVNNPNDLVQQWINGSTKLTPDGKRYERPAYDRISILFDTNGDGRMDKKQIFYEGLELVTGFVLYQDGVIAAAAPDIWRLRDSNGDGKADTAEKLYTGLGTFDTHAVINNLRWGLDGWIYATHGYSSSPKVTSGDGNKNFGAIGSGVVRFRPDGSAFEQFSSKGGNTWGLQVCWDQEIFYTQPTSGDLLMNVVLSEDRLARAQIGGTPGYKVVRKSPKSFSLIAYDQIPYVQIDLVGSFTAAAGAVIYDGGAWPAEWNYNYFTTEPTINLVHHQIISPDGVSYKAAKAPGREQTEFLRGRDPWFRPIEVRVGPDGALYVIDFYNQAVAHNDTRGTRHGPRNAAIRPDRDHYYGRIWRLQHKQAQRLSSPNLNRANTAQRIAALEHPNQHVRFNAARLLAEAGDARVAPALRALASSRKSPQARVAALWTLAQLGQLDPRTIAAMANDPDAAVRKNVAMALSAQPLPDNAVKASALKLLGDEHPRVRLEAIHAVACFPMDSEIAFSLAATFPLLSDNWSRAAFFAASAPSPARVLDAALSGAPSEESETLVRRLTKQIAEAQNAEEAARLIIALSRKPDSANKATQTILENLASGLRPETVPEWSAELHAALRMLLTSPAMELSDAALPFVARWDKNGVMKEELLRYVQTAIARVADTSQSDERRAQIARALLAARRVSPQALPAVAQLLGSGASVGLQRAVVEALGEIPDAAAGAAIVTAFPNLQSDAQTLAMEQLLKRASWSLALLDALESGAIDAEKFGPVNLHRLRLHADEVVARRANEVIDQVRGPATQQKNALIARLLPAVEQRGDAEKGKEVFARNCASCHRFGETGREVGPPLVGVGAHGPEELLTQILDPNREVDPSFAAWAIQTKDGEIYDGLIARENRAVVTLSNAAGEHEIPVSQIASRRNTGRSLMPEGFETLGEEALRDLLAFLRAGEERFRFVDLTPAFTADSRYGLYWQREQRDDTLKFTQFGVVHVEGVPFYIADPAKSPSGKNIIVLKGGAEGSFSKTQMPQRVEAKLGFAANRLHFLGGVAGWGHPLGGENVPALKATVLYADGQMEEIIMHNSKEFADYIRIVNVPGSKLTRGLVSANQLRWFSLPLKRTSVISKLILESYDNAVAPTTVAITAELAEGNSVESDATASAAEAGQPMIWGNGLKVLLVGGGTYHDFPKWFHETDAATLKAAGGISVNYTDDPKIAAHELGKADVLVLSANDAGFTAPEFRKALTDFADAGKGIVLLHAALWYNWHHWPEYNRTFAGGGSRGHDNLREFEVTVTATNHPLTQNLPTRFAITDELYWFESDPRATAMETLATAHSPQKNTLYPQIFVVLHPKTRIVGITLGHDGRAHQHPAFRQLLQNAVRWVSGK